MRALAPSSALSFKALGQDVSLRFGNGIAAQTWIVAQTWTVAQPEVQELRDKIARGYGANLDALLQITSIQPATGAERSLPTYSRMNYVRPDAVSSSRVSRYPPDRPARTPPFIDDPSLTQPEIEDAQRRTPPVHSRGSPCRAAARRPGSSGGCQNVSGIGVVTRQKADPQFVLSPGEARTATFNYTRYVGKTAIGTAFSPTLVIEQLEVLPSQQIRSVREHSVSFANVTAGGAADAAQSINDAARQIEEGLKSIFKRR